MSRQLAIALYIVCLVAVVVGVDILFLRNRTWLRLIVNIAIVAVFAILYFAFHSMSGRG